jgi:hypothetical protein
LDLFPRNNNLSLLTCKSWHGTSRIEQGFTDYIIDVGGEVENCDGREVPSYFCKSSGSLKKQLLGGNLKKEIFFYSRTGFLKVPEIFSITS